MARPVAQGASFCRALSTQTQTQTQQHRLRRRSPMTVTAATSSSKERGSNYETGQHSEWVNMAHEDEQFLFGSPDEGVYYPLTQDPSSILVTAGAVILVAGLPLEAVTALRVILDREGGQFIRLVVPSTKNLHLTVAAALLLPEIDWSKPRPTRESGKLSSAGGAPGSPYCLIVNGIDSREVAIVDRQLQAMGFGRVAIVRAAPAMASQLLGEVTTKAAEKERKERAKNLELRELHRQRRERMESASQPSAWTASSTQAHSRTGEEHDDGEQGAAQRTESSSAQPKSSDDRNSGDDDDGGGYFEEVVEAEREFTKLDISEFGAKMVELADLSDEELDALILEERKRIHQEMKRKPRTTGEEMA